MRVSGTIELFDRNDNLLDGVYYTSLEVRRNKFNEWNNLKIHGSYILITIADKHLNPIKKRIADARNFKPVP